MSTTPSKAKQHPTRRALLKTGAHAAWAVPAVQVVSAVTEYAAAGSGDVPAPPAGVLELTGTFKNNGGNGTATLTVENTGNAIVKSPQLIFSGTGIKYDKSMTVTGGWTLERGTSTVSALYTGSLNPTAKLDVVFEFKVSSSSGTNTVSVVVSGSKDAATDGAVGGDELRDQTF